MSLSLCPMTLGEARRFVGEHHRHSLPPVGHLFSVGVSVDGVVVGVAIASRPIARMLQDGTTVEVVRTCTTGEKNANSMLYGAMFRAATALGYRRVITYTLASESGSSLRAAGYAVEAQVPGQPTWSRPSRPRVQADLFGNERRPLGPKIRWVREYVA